MPAKPFRAVFLDAGGTLLHADRRFLLDSLAAVGVSRDEAAIRAAEHAARARLESVLRSDEEAVLVDPTDRLGELDCARIRCVTELPAWLEGRPAVARGRGALA